MDKERRSKSSMANNPLLNSKTDIFGQTMEDDETSTTKIVPQLCGSTVNAWGKAKCFSGITHICAGNETYPSGTTLGFSNEGNVWRTDVGMGRGFDLAAGIYYEFLEGIAKWNRNETEMDTK